MSGKFNRMGLLYPFSVFISAKICGGSCGENTVFGRENCGQFSDCCIYNRFSSFIVCGEKGRYTGTCMENQRYID